MNNVTQRIPKERSTATLLAFLAAIAFFNISAVSAIAIEHYQQILSRD